MSGDLDSSLDMIGDALEARRRQIGNDHLRNLRPGDEGLLTGIRPVALEGQPVTFQRAKNTKLVVHLQEDAAHWKAGQDLTIHRNCWRNI